MMDVNPQFPDYDFRLGVWQTDCCARCGGCCYVSAIHEIGKKGKEKCKYLTVNYDKNTSCVLHGSKNQPYVCKSFSCVGKGRNNSSFGPHERLLIAEAASDILKIKPVNNFKEILNMLKSMDGKKP